MEIVMNLFTSFVAMVAGVVFLTGVVNQWLKVESGVGKVAVSWVVALLVALVGFGMQWGYMADCGSVAEWQGWAKAVLVGIGCGLCANGMYDTTGVWRVLGWLFGLMKRSK